MANFTLTSGFDNVTGTASNDTVNGTSGTLNSWDSLTGGAGIDTLALSGYGPFRIDQLATFTGFENITVNDFSTVDPTNLYLGSQSIAVTNYGLSPVSVYLGSGAVTCSGIQSVVSHTPFYWTVGNAIDGGTISLGSVDPDGGLYDLTANTLRNIKTLSGFGIDLTVKVNSAVAGGVANFNGDPTNAKLVTSDAELDLSHSTVIGFTVTSSNAIGTNFTVQDIGTALQVRGGFGTDTLTAQGFVFSTDQRKAIFATTSVERIVDTSGTYTALLTINSNGGGDTAAVSIVESATAVTTVTATDQDVGQPLYYSIIGGADASKFTIGNSTGALSFVTAPDFELPTDAGGNNVYDVTVQVSDGHGGIDTQTITVTVTDALENSAPIITSNGGGDTAAVSIAENTTAIPTVTASDPDVVQTLSYSIIGGADASKFIIGATTGALSFVTAPNFELPTDAGGNNVYDLIVQASDDNGGIDTQAIAVMVTDVFENPVTLYDPTNVYPWASVTYGYDGLNRLDYTRVQNDDASFYVVDYDQANSGAWKFATAVYDSQGRHDYSHVQNDDASFYVVDYDQANSAAWNYITSSYDPQGAVQNTFVQNDDGSSWFV